jgi:peptidyl-prolyl cis-trans isomerase C
MLKSLCLTRRAASAVALVALFPALAWSQAAQSQDSLTRAFVTVNGEPQSLARAEVLLREQIARGAPNSPQVQAAVREALVTQALMAQAAVQEGLDKLPLVQAQMELARQSVLIQAWQQQTAQSKEVSDEDLRVEYERQVKLLGPKQYRLRHILVNEEDTAKLLLERLRSGGKLADLAGEYSRDDATRGTGGLTDWLAQGEMQPALLKAVESLKAGQLAPAPVRGPAGWHVVALEEERAFTPPARDTLRPQLQRAIVQQRIQTAVEQLRQSAKVE